MKYLRLLWWWLTFQGMRLLWGNRKVQVIGKDGCVRRGRGSRLLKETSTFGTFILYWDPLNRDGDWMGGVHVPVADENVLWCRGWEKERGKALLSAQALT